MFVMTLTTLASDDDFRSVPLPLMMTSARVVDTSVNVITSSPSQDYTSPCLDLICLPCRFICPLFIHVEGK